MSVVPFLRQFVNERLTAAAEEIFEVLEKTIVEHEKQIDRQRRLLDIVLKAEELPQQHVCEEDEHLSDQQQLFVQERNSSLDQEDPEPPQIEEQQDELWTSEEGEQLVLKQETDVFMLIPTSEESDPSEDQTRPNFSVDETQPFSNIPVKSSVVSEPSGDQQLLSHNSHEAESQDQEGGKNGDSGSTDAEPEQQNQHHANNPAMATIHCHTQTFKCDMCEKAFKCKPYLQRHMIVHKCTKLLTCKTCGKSFQYNSYLKVHMRIHTGERPYTCKTCGKDFRFGSNLNDHMRIHTGERPYTCKTCGKDFRFRSELKVHVETHMRVKHVEELSDSVVHMMRYFYGSHLARCVRSHKGLAALYLQRMWEMIYF
ncbi:uncharacterized protein LOC142947365 [Anarhichas minor]|uniref:uncharacterized protein LOC142947365 n=1 Tax=Anarhichas minor TaxID=65739 RepID=UPI003F73F167